MLFSTENELPKPGLLIQRNLSFDFALEAATAALETARSRGYHVGVAVTDRSGQLLVLLRDDGGGAHLLDGARRKAFTAVGAHSRTSVLSKAVDTRSGEPAAPKRRRAPSRNAAAIEREADVPPTLRQRQPG